MTRYLCLQGDAVALEQALDQLYVHAEVQAVVWQGEDVHVALGDAALPELSMVQVTDLPVSAADMQRTGLEEDQVIMVSDDLLVRPPWVPGKANFAGVELVVPRAMAFGSGEHGSTQAALRLLHTSWRDDCGSVADVGTGTGILALYAQTRGCAKVTACDVDPDAVRAARDLLPQAQVVLGTAKDLQQEVGAVDLVVANMTGAELQSALPDLLKLWNRRGALILSGLKQDQVADMIRAVGLEQNKQLQVGEYCGLLFVAQLN